MKFLLLIFICFQVYSNEILVSYFRPYGPYDVNHTKAVAEFLRHSNLLKQYGISIKLCGPLDVSFHSDRDDLRVKENMAGPFAFKESAYSQLRDCMNQYPEVSQVISLGEGSCDLKYEAFAYNVMVSMFAENRVVADHNGVVLPYAQKINSSDPQFVELDSSTDLRSFCHASTVLPDFEKFNLYSVNPGAFVCNNLSYHMGRSIQDELSDKSFSFVHIPAPLDRASRFCTVGSSSKIIKSFRYAPDGDTEFSRYVAEQLTSFILSKEKVIREDISFESRKDRRSFDRCVRRKERQFSKDSRAPLRAVRLAR